MRILVLCVAMLFGTELYGEPPLQFRMAEFDDRADLGALAEEISAHDIARTGGLLRIRFSYHFDTMAQAEAACDAVWGPTVSTLAGGTADMGFCSISLDGSPTPHSLYLLREAARPVAEFPGAVAQHWSVMREATALEKGDAPAENGGLDV